MKTYWILGGIISDPARHLLLKKYLCYGCGQNCQPEIPVRDPAPKDCLNPDRLKYFEDLRRMASSHVLLKGG